MCFPMIHNRFSINKTPYVIGKRAVFCLYFQKGLGIGEDRKSVVQGKSVGRGGGRRRHTRSKRDWSSDVCSSDLPPTKVKPSFFNCLLMLSLNAVEAGTSACVFQ